MPNDLSPNEKKIVQILRGLRPYERVEISADKLGKYDAFLVHRSHKEMLD